jgi:dynein heavy chain
VLRDPCTELNTAAINSISEKLPRIIDLIRMIWLHSPHYNTRERITSLFRKLSNVIIQRCTDAISLDDVFDGDVVDAARTIRDSITCCEGWEHAYNTCREAHETFSDKRWLVSYSAIFAQNAAFIQRCRDLLEVCDSQTLFARKRGADSDPLPTFAGSRAVELSRSLAGIEIAYKETVSRLRASQGEILDVKSSRYQPLFNAFKVSLKDLEVMLQNTINTAFETATTVEASVELLAIFAPFRSREPVRRTLDKKTHAAFKLFAEHLDFVKKAFNNNRHAPPLEQGLPRLAGAAMWAQRLKAEIDVPQSALAGAQFIEPGTFGNDVLQQHSLLSTALKDFVTKTHSQWATDIGADLPALLNSTLMKRSANRALLMLNFDHNLLRLFREHKYWERMGADIPQAVQDMAHRSEEMRTLRGFIMLVVRDYNTIIECLSTEERQLFRERIRYLDKKIQPGLTQLSWASKGIKDYYVAECR